MTKEDNVKYIFNLESSKFSESERQTNKSIKQKIDVSKPQKIDLDMAKLLIKKKKKLILKEKKFNFGSQNDVFQLRDEEKGEINLE